MMKIRKYALEIVLAIVIIALVGITIAQTKPLPAGLIGSIFAPPSVGPAQPSSNYILQLDFTVPAALYGRTLASKVITPSGEEEMGSFVVRDIRLWRLDGFRIINNQFKFKNQPLHLILNDITSGEPKTLFEGDINGPTTLNPTSQDIATKLNLTLKSD